MLADRGLQGHCAQKRDAQLLRLKSRTILTKNMRLMAARRALVIGHILHDAQNRHIQFLKHGNSLARVNQGNILWCGYDNRPVQAYFLRQSQLRVARARG